MRPLTASELRERTTQLYEDVIAEHGPVEEVVFEVISCDGCGVTHNRLDGDPTGWTTDGDREHGYVDHCAACS